MMPQLAIKSSEIAAGGKVAASGQGGSIMSLEMVATSVRVGLIDGGVAGVVLKGGGYASNYSLFII
jgi:hypothetical protein